ncbi:MAG: hypothetical protein WBQ21_05065 [Solirubrobacteraceae bacterium]
MVMSDHDRKLLWGKAARRCAICNEVLTKPETVTDREAVIGEEAHIVGERPGSARYRSVDRAWSASYENRILLCPNDHRLIDAQPGDWPEERLLRRKADHEELMTGRTEHGQRSGIVFELPRDARMTLLTDGKGVLDVVGGALAFQMDHDRLQSDAEQDAAASLLQSARDWGDIYGEIGPAGHIDAERDLNERFETAIDAGLLVYGAQVETTVRIGEARDCWAVAYMHLRRAADLRRDVERAAAASDGI